MIPTKSKLEVTLPKRFYFAADIYAQEKERIFYRDWVCIGRAEQLARAGEYLLLEVAGESILVLRGKDQTLRAFYNVCRHRGSQLVPALSDAAAGRRETRAHGTFAGGIRCPYHAWTYALDGALRTAPFLNDGGGFYKDEFSLHPVAVDCWGGFMFVHLTPADAHAPKRDLTSQLDGVPARLARYPLADLRLARRIVYDVAANWKVLVENYNECYHCGGVHPELCDIVPQFKKGGGADLEWEHGIPHKEGAFTFTFSGTTARAPFPGLSDAEKVRHKGELVYPNFMLSLAADHVAAFTLWPQGPTRTVVVCDFLFHPNESASGAFDPSDAVDFWDLVNRQDWAICENVQRGMASRVFASGFYAPMESWSLDIRRYIAERLQLTTFEP
ncbi:MAG: aromatic ring-hydroxylating dioxygenase subunit alpha [Candidatus Eremiobacteraeota bacterium]|nr:aromatic ring-hydroxylating dioxygenase subunit alpha [Candidatus Eremiobacteraeota bacterium]